MPGLELTISLFWISSDNHKTKACILILIVYGDRN